MFGLILDGIKTLVGWGKEKAKANHEKDMAQIELETRLLLDTQKANSRWEIAQLNDKDKFIRYGAFLIYASPLIACWISPEIGDRILNGWARFNQFTHNQAQVFDSICLAVFGIKQIPQFLGATVGAVKDALKK